MCGITGWLSRQGPLPGARERLARMCDAMRHRGPDAEGLWLDGPVALGMRRLAVIDVAGGQQPIANEDGTVHVVFNGEIYNHGALREGLLARGHRLATRSDTEVLVHLYEEHGEGFVTHLTGMFAIALWDARQGRLLLARDRLGEKPLYWAELEGGLVFGSELKCLLAHGGVPRTLALPALSAYLACEYVPAPQAILQGVHKLPPAHLLVADAGGVRVSPYWRLDLTPRTPAPSGAEAAQALAAHLTRAVGLQLVADVPLGVFLSGGIDSSTVAAVAARELRARGAGPLQTFSIGFADPSFDESAHARAVATHIGSRHHERVLEPGLLPALLPTVTALLDEPFADASILPTHLLAAFAREHVTVALGGDGGDELFAGYPTYQAARVASLLDGAPAGLRLALAAALRAGVGWLPVSHDNLSLDFKLKRFASALAATPLQRHAAWLGAFDPALQARLLTADVRAALRDHDPWAAQAAAWEAGRGLDGTARLLGVDLATYLPDDILFKVDRASMMASLETRAPLLDHQLVAWAAGLPSDLKLRGWQTKHLLKRVAAGLLPAAIVQRPKKGFGIPVARWLRGGLRGPLLELLSAERLRAGGLFEPAFVEGLVREHLDGRVDHRKLLWTLMMFEWWRERYLLSRS
ncbi:MAG: asparagine synthase (glutamine-hydrolyzing) [Candidatus Sericytochromatia bacterium]|nr:asparagine synthase (glutamine-hydrolyzing) [Candidatus Sericytochromatia bacterium]